MMKSTKSSGFTFGKKLTITAIAVCITIAAFSFKTLDFRNTASPKKAIITDGMARQGEGDLEGWFKAGSKPSSYEIGTTKVDGNTVAFIKSVENQVDGFGTIMQNASLEDYKGKRVKLRARIKTEGVSDWCGLWFRVDGDGRQPLAFDNMQHRPIKGTTDWKEYEVVLDVSQESLALAYGVLLSNTGNVWIDDFNFEVVDKSVPVTSQSQSSSPQSKPKNLDFEN